MFSYAQPRVAAGGVGLATDDLGGMAAALVQLSPEVDDSERVDRIRLLSELASAAAAAQAQETARFAASQRAKQRAAGLPADRVGRGVAAQVALALRISPARAQKYVGWTTVLTRELPHTFAALQAGRMSEWRAMIVARETIWLSREHRAQVESELAHSLEALGDRKLEAATRTIAYRLEPEGYVARARVAENDRYVSMRPAPDAMVRLTAWADHGGHPRRTRYRPIPRGRRAGRGEPDHDRPGDDSCDYATRSVELPGVGRRSATATTSFPSSTAGRPASTTGRATAKPAITPNKPRVDFDTSPQSRRTTRSQHHHANRALLHQPRARPTRTSRIGHCLSRG
jgi:hypothetical protein